MKKKILLSVLVLASALLLASCKKKPPVEPEKKAPVLHGIIDVEVQNGAQFDPLDGVSAVDEVDGDLTGAITVEGTVDTKVDKVYTLTYKVVNSAGLEASKDRKVTVYTPNRPPVIKGNQNYVLAVGETFTPEAVTASDPEDGDVTNKLVTKGTVDTTKVGMYQIVYTVKDAEGLTASAVSNVLVVLAADKDKLANGSYNFKFADSDVKNTFFAAAERYLLDNMVGGIPFYVANAFSLKANRINLPVDSFIPSFGWGFSRADITLDDSVVGDAEGNPGQTGKYTYRTWNNSQFSTLNYWVYDDSVSADFMDPITGSFFRMVLKASKDGWEWAPDLAAGFPVPANPDAKGASKTWTITVRDGLEWAFHPSVDTSSFQYKALTAADFVWSYREALERGYFRALSGGGDFVKEIEGAEDFSKVAATIFGEKELNFTPNAEQKAELDAAWEKVGITLSEDGKSITFKTKQKKSEFDAMYLMQWPAIQRDLYEKHGKLYGSDEKTIASSGLYVMTDHQDGKITKYVKNTKYPHAGETKWTGQEIVIYENATIAFQAFLDGKLDVVGVPNERLSEFISDPRLLQTPDATTWRLNINGLQTVERQQAQFPGSKYVPEPMLGYTEFRKALYWILDRKDLQQNWVPASGIGISYFSSAYYVDPVSGIPYRSSPQAKAIEDDYGVEDWGYDEGLAKAYFKQAIVKAIADGHYKKGTGLNPTIITLDVLFMNLTVSEATKLRADFVENAFEKLIDNEYFFRVEVNIKDTPFPDIYYNYQMTGDFDIAIGGISGSTLDASSFLDVFSSDNRGGFTINWGFDSSLPEIEVTWTEDDVERTEIFSYDAIVSALNGKVSVQNGMEVPPKLVTGEHTTWSSALNTLEDFFDGEAFPEFEENATYEIIKDTNTIGGIWIVLPADLDFEDLVDLFFEAGFDYFDQTEDYDDEWVSEFSGPFDAMHAKDLLNDLGAEICDAYGIDVPVDDEGAPLNAIFIY